MAYNQQQAIDTFLKDVEQGLRLELAQANPEILELIFLHFHRRMVSKLVNELRVTRQGFKLAGRVKALPGTLPEKLSRLKDRSIRHVIGEAKYPNAELGERTVYLVSFPDGLKLGAYRDLLKKYRLKMLDPLAFLDFLAQTEASRTEVIRCLWHVGSQAYSMLFDPESMSVSISLAQSSERKGCWYICEPAQ